MRRILLFLTGILANFLQLSADTHKTFTITGSLTYDSLRFTPQKVNKLYLVYNEGGKDVLLDSCLVRNKQFQFKGVSPAYAKIGLIKGFDNGEIQLFVESGKTVILPFDARFPSGAKVSGTPNNEILREYTSRYDSLVKVIRQGNTVVSKSIPSNFNEKTPLFKEYQRMMFYGNSLLFKLETMKFFQSHLDAPLSLYLLRYDLFNVFTPRVIERQFLRALSPKLSTHPLYKEIVNQLRAANMQVGTEAPDIEGTTPDGRKVFLSQYKGSYVLLDFWASWCGPCRREFPFLKQVLKETETFKRFKILSYSIDTKRNDWINAITNNKLSHSNWIHISTLKGWSSDAVSLFNVNAVPRTILLNPEGKIMAFDLRGEGLIKELRDIMNGIKK